MISTPAKWVPLLIDCLNNEKSALIKHYLMLLLIDQRPHEWRMHAENYIASVSKNSFYLMDVHRALIGEYMYGFLSSKALDDMKYLLKKILSRTAMVLKIQALKQLTKFLIHIYLIEKLNKKPCLVLCGHTNDSRISCQRVSTGNSFDLELSYANYQNLRTQRFKRLAQVAGKES